MQACSWGGGGRRIAAVAAVIVCCWRMILPVLCRCLLLLASDACIGLPAGSGSPGGPSRRERKEDHLFKRRRQSRGVENCFFPPLVDVLVRAQRQIAGQGCMCGTYFFWLALPVPRALT